MIYQSYRRVDIQSGTLSMLYYVSLAVAVLFVAVTVFVSHGHLSFSPPKVTRFIRTIEPENFHEIAKCPPRCGYEDDASDGNACVDSECTVWDWLQIVEASREEVFVSTYIEERMEKRVCPRTARHCRSDQPLWVEVNRTSYVTASPEMMNLRIEHDVLATTAVAGAGGMRGLLLPSDTCHGIATGGWFPSRTPTGGVPLINGEDELSLDALLEAAGAPSLQLSDLVDGTSESIRRKGLYLDVTVYYSNVWRTAGNFYSWIFPTELKYIYCVDSVSKKKTMVERDANSPGAKDSAKEDAAGAHSSTFGRSKGSKFIATVGEETSFLQRQWVPGLLSTDETRVVRRQFGVHIHLRNEGKIGSVSFGAAIAFIAGALSLLGLPWTITELYLSLMPMMRRTLPAWYRGALVVAAKEDAKIETKKTL